MKCLLRTISVCSPSVAAWAVRDSLPCQDKVSAACLFTGTMPLRAGKEGTLNHSGHDRRTPHTHTQLPMGAQCPWLLALGVSEGNARHRTGWALHCPQGAACPHRVLYVYHRGVRARHYTRTHINQRQRGLFPEWEIQTNRGRMSGKRTSRRRRGSLDCQIVSSYFNKHNRHIHQHLLTVFSRHAEAWEAAILFFTELKVCREFQGLLLNQ